MDSNRANQTIVKAHERASLAGLVCVLTLVLFDVLFGAVSPSSGRCELSTVAAEFVAGFVLLGAVLAGGMGLLARLGGRWRVSPGRALPWLAALLGVLVLVPGLVRAAPSSDGVVHLIRRGSEALLLLVLVAAVPVGVARLVQTHDLRARWSVFALVSPTVLAACIVVLLVWARVPPAYGLLAAVLALPVLVTTVLIAWRWLRRAADAQTLTRVYGVATAALVITGVAGLMRPGPASAAAVQAPATAPVIRHVILLTIDALRADAVEVYDLNAPATPAINALAADSLVFGQAISPAPWTLPAFCSMMTGVAPTVHQATTFESRLPEGFSTLAERLRGAGYLTAAVGNNTYLLPNFGLDRGFVQYQMYPRHEPPSLGRWLLKWCASPRYAEEATTAELTDLSIDWVRRHADRPFFFWLHYYDPHMPYTPPREFAPAGVPPVRLGQTFEHDAFHSAREGYFVPTPEEVAWIRALYEGEVRYVDRQVGRLLAAVRECGIYDDALIILTSDHGEEFWDHGGFEHGHSVYEELLHVPLLVKLPRAVRTGRIDTAVCTQRLMATVLELCDLPNEAAAGTAASLSPVWAGAGKAMTDAIISSGCAYYEDQVAVRRGEWKYIRRRLSGCEELYDLVSDPRERSSVLGSAAEWLAAARQELSGHELESRALREQWRVTRPRTAKLDRLTLQKLRSLGYTQ